MKEKDENSYTEDYSNKNLDVTINSIDKYTKLLESKDHVTIHFDRLNSIYIDINISSFIKINQLMNSYPQETVHFLFKKTQLYTPRSSFHFTRSSIKSDKNGDSPFSSIKLQSSNKKEIIEENINTDIIENNNDNNKDDILMNKLSNKKSRNNNNVISLGNEELIDNIKIEHEMIANNVKRLKLFDSYSDKDNPPKRIKIKTSANPKLVLFKWIYHFYIILSLLIFLHFITFLFSEYNYVIFYKLISLLLIISLAYVGYIGIKYKDSKPPLFIFNDKYLFWVHFSIFIITIFSFTGLITAGGNFKLINCQGIIGYFISLIYVISLIIEGFYAIYYDVIIEDIIWDRNNNNKNKFNDYMDNNLNIQLTEIN